MRVGYVRVSGADQNLDRQIAELNVEKTFSDYASGKDQKRPGLQLLIDFVREGDTVTVHSMDRLARNLDDLRGLVRQFRSKGVAVEFLKENLCFNKTESHMDQLMLSIIGAFAEFERALIRERQREGIELAKNRGVYRGRKPVLSKKDIPALQERVRSGETKASIAKELGIGRVTLYRYLTEQSPSHTNA